MIRSANRADLPHPKKAIREIEQDLCHPAAAVDFVLRSGA
jgi:hypothetical protein